MPRRTKQKKKSLGNDMWPWKYGLPVCLVDCTEFCLCVDIPRIMN